MKQSVQQRLRKLEQDFMRVRDKQGRTPLEALLERRKRRLEANGEIYVEPPPIAPGIKGRNNCRDSAVSLQNTRDRTAALGLVSCPSDCISGFCGWGQCMSNGTA